jgi:predicted peptidase
VETVVPVTEAAPFDALAGRLARVPRWIFHGEEDNAVPVDQSRQAAAVFASGGVAVQYTELPGTGHNSWDAAFGSANFAAWLLKQKR